MDAKIPFIKEPIGLGDMAKAITSAVGVKPCGGCQKRAEALNKALSFSPSKPSPLAAKWTDPQHIPDGWRLHRECSRNGNVSHFLLNDSTGAAAIMDVVSGLYRNYRGFCCGTLRETAEKRWEAACQSR